MVFAERDVSLRGGGKVPFAGIVAEAGGRGWPCCDLLRLLLVGLGGIVAPEEEGSVGVDGATTTDGTILRDALLDGPFGFVGVLLGASDATGVAATVVGTFGVTSFAACSSGLRVEVVCARFPPARPPLLPPPRPGPPVLNARDGFPVVVGRTGSPVRARQLSVDGVAMDGSLFKRRDLEIV